jgi:hypothetical protein
MARYNVDVRRLILLVAVVLLAPAPAAADDWALLRARDRYLPPAQRAFPNTPDGYQARYDAARDLMEAALAAGPAGPYCNLFQVHLLLFAETQARVAEAADRPIKHRPPALPKVTARCRPTSRERVRPRRLNPWLGVVEQLGAPRPVRRTDYALARRLAAIGARFDGWAGFWVHDLHTGRAAGWNADARFPAASTVKLGAMAAALRAAAIPEYGRHWYDLQQIGAWSSNLGANRIYRQLGPAAVNDGLRRLGMTSSTYPGSYRATTAGLDAPKPPPLVSGRVTTAKDLGRALYRLHAAAVGDPQALRRLGLTHYQAKQGLRLLLDPEREGDNLGLLRPWLGKTQVAEKNGWFSSLRITAAVVYLSRRPVIVVVEAYRPGLTTRAARSLGREVLRALDAR